MQDTSDPWLEWNTVTTDEIGGEAAALDEEIEAITQRQITALQVGFRKRVKTVLDEIHTTVQTEAMRGAHIADIVYLKQQLCEAAKSHLCREQAAMRRRIFALYAKAGYLREAAEEYLQAKGQGQCMDDVRLGGNLYRAPASLPFSPGEACCSVDDAPQGGAAPHNAGIGN